MIRFDGVGVRYPDSPEPALTDVTFRVPEGELALVVGPTGAGKSTLLRAAAGLVPHFSGGHLTGTVVVAGRDTRTHLPRDLADVVGVVGQAPATGFVTDSVEEELAYGMEQIGLEPGVMRRRVEEVLDLLDLAPLRHRPLADLSGGEQQRVAIGAVLTSRPRVLGLDEPSSALDPGAAEEVLAALTRLVHDLGLTVLVAEHRLERVVQYADRVIVVGEDGRVTSDAPAVALATAPVAPPVVELGRLAGWDPLPLSVRDARRLAGPLRERLVTAPPRPARPAPGAVVLRATSVAVHHGAVRAVVDASLDLHAGEVVALMGRNGAGKSSLLWALQGSGPRSAGTVTVAGTDPAAGAAAAARRLVALVPQNPLDLLYLDTVGAECAAADVQARVPAGATAAVLERLGVGLSPAAHPRDLSEGERLALALAVQLVAEPRVLLADEPTRGLDYRAKRRLVGSLRDLAGRGGAVLLATHDVEFAAAVADRVLTLADGEVVADGPVTQVLAGSPLFAPQVAKILHPLDLLTVAEVSAALAVTP